MTQAANKYGDQGVKDRTAAAVLRMQKNSAMYQDVLGTLAAPAVATFLGAQAGAATLASGAGTASDIFGAMRHQINHEYSDRSDAAIALVDAIDSAFGFKDTKLGFGGDPKAVQSIVAKIHQQQTASESKGYMFSEDTATQGGSKSSGDFGRNLARCEYQAGSTKQLRRTIALGSTEPWRIVSVPHPERPHDTDLCFDVKELQEYIDRVEAASGGAGALSGALRIPFLGHRERQVVGFFTPAQIAHIRFWHISCLAWEHEIEGMTADEIAVAQRLSQRFTPMEKAALEKLCRGSCPRPSASEPKPDRATVDGIAAFSDENAKTNDEDEGEPAFDLWYLASYSAHTLWDYTLGALGRGISEAISWVTTQAQRAWKYIWNHPAHLRLMVLLADFFRLVICFMISWYLMGTVTKDVALRLLQPLYEGFFFKVVVMGIRYAAGYGVVKAGIFAGAIIASIEAIRDSSMMPATLRPAFSAMSATARWCQSTVTLGVFTTVATAGGVALAVMTGGLSIPVAAAGAAGILKILPLEQVAQAAFFKDILDQFSYLMRAGQFRHILGDENAPDNPWVVFRGDLSSGPGLIQKMAVSAMASLCSVLGDPTSRFVRLCQATLGLVQKFFSLYFVYRTIAGIYIDLTSIALAKAGGQSVYDQIPAVSCIRNILNPIVPVPTLENIVKQPDASSSPTSTLLSNLAMYSFGGIGPG